MFPPAADFPCFDRKPSNLQLSCASRVHWRLGMEPQPGRTIPTLSSASYIRLLRHNRNFRRLWMAQIVSEVGDWFYTLSIYTLLLQLTGHAGSVALALVLQVLPQTFVGPTAGVVNDRLKRKHVMIAADMVR